MSFLHGTATDATWNIDAAKPTQLPSSGEYFVTICTAGRRCILGRVEDAKVQLSDTGKILDTCWRKTPEHFPGIRMDTYPIMPNHVHGIIEITPHATCGGGVPSPRSTGLFSKCGETLHKPPKPVTVDRLWA